MPDYLQLQVSLKLLLLKRMYTQMQTHNETRSNVQEKKIIKWQIIQRTKYMWYSLKEAAAPKRKWRGRQHNCPTPQEQYQLSNILHSVPGSLKIIGRYMMHPLNFCALKWHPENMPTHTHKDVQRPKINAGEPCSMKVQDGPWKHYWRMKN